MKQCPACGANNSSDAPSCSICGADLSQVGSDATARTLFGMPVVRVSQNEKEPAPKAEAAPAAPAPSASVPAPASSAPAETLTGTRRGFRALSAVTDDHGSIGSVGSMDASMLELQQTTVGLPRSRIVAAAPAPTPEPAPSDDAPRSTLFGAPSPFGGQASPASDDVMLPPSMVAAQARAKAEAEAARAQARIQAQAAQIEESPYEAKTVESLSPGYSAAPDTSSVDAGKQTLMGAPSPFGATSAAFEAADAADRAEGLGGIRPVVEDADEGIQSTRVGMPAADAGAAPDAPDYRTLVGPPQPLAEVIRARDAARAKAAEEPDPPAPAAAAAPAADQYQTLVGPPQPLAEAIRARDAARQVASSPEPVLPSSGSQSNKASIIVDQAALADEMSARDRDRGGRRPSVIVDQGPAERPSVIVDEPMPRSAPTPAAKQARPAARIGARPTAVQMRADAEAERAAAARFAEAIAEEEAAVAARRRRGRFIAIFAVLIIAGVAIGLWLAGDAHAFQARSDRVEAENAEAAAAGAEWGADVALEQTSAGRPIEIDGGNNNAWQARAGDIRSGPRVEGALLVP